MKVASKTAGFPKRTSRSERSKAAIAKAMVELIQEGIKKPTAPQVAERAGVSERLVYHHFKDMESLFLEAGRIMMPFRRELLEQPPEWHTSSERLSGFVDWRAKAYEFLAPTRRFAVHHGYNSDLIDAAVQQVWDYEAKQACRTFEEELSRFKGTERAEREAMLRMACSWQYWALLRVRERLSVPKAKESMRRAIRASLDL